MLPYPSQLTVTLPAPTFVRFRPRRRRRTKGGAPSSRCRPSEFLTSTKAPTFDPSASMVPGRDPDERADRHVACRWRAPAPPRTAPSRRRRPRVDDPHRRTDRPLRPIVVSPSRTSCRADRRVAADAHPDVDVGGGRIDERDPVGHCAALIRSRTTRSTAASPPREFSPITPPVSTEIAETRSPLSSRIGKMSLR